MKQFALIALTAMASFMISCGSSDPCEGVNCVKGSCVDGTCDCELGWEGELCDEQSTPRSITISKMVLKKFPVDDLGAAWDNEDDGSLADVTILVKSLLGDLFKPTDIVNQTHENADGSTNYDIPCTVKISDMKEEIIFEIVDYDFDDNFNVVYEFMSSIKIQFADHIDDFPSVISISSSTGKAAIDLHVEYGF